MTTQTVTTTSAETGTRALEIDRSHSDVAFQVRHLLSRVRGRFSDFSGTIQLDPSHPERSRVEVTIQAASVDTAEPQRDQHLRSADFFEVDTYPTLTFTSTAITPRGGDRYHIAGNLTIHGVTKPVTLAATFLGGARDPWGAERFGFDAEVTLNRKDFGLHWNAALETGGFLVGDEVKVELSVQAK